MSNTKTPHITLDNFWPYQAIVLADQISRYTLSVVRAEADLNLSQWRVLAAIAEKAGRTAANVTAITPMDKTIVSRAVSSLIEAGLVVKTTDSGDKRRSSLSVTTAGQRIYANIAPKLTEAMISSLGDAISPEDFTKMLKTFIRKMDDIAPYSKS